MILSIAAERSLQFRSRRVTARVDENFGILRVAGLGGVGTCRIERDPDTPISAASVDREPQRCIEIARRGLEQAKHRRLLTIALLGEIARLHLPLRAEQLPALLIERREVLDERHSCSSRRLRFHCRRRSRRLFCLRSFVPRVREFLARVRDVGFEHPGPALGLRSFRGECYAPGCEVALCEQCRDAGSDGRGFIRLALFAANVTEGRLVEQAIEHAGDAVLFKIEFAGNGVEPDVERLEERAHPVKVGLRNRVVFVVVAFRAVHREPKEALAHMLHGFLHPRVAVEEEEIAREKSGRTQLLRLGGIELIGGEHLAKHLVVRHVGIQRLHDPIAEVPHVLLAVAELLVEPPPIAVAPNVHPMPCPTLAMPRVGEQSVHSGFIPIPRHVIFRRRDFLSTGRNADEIQPQTAHQHFARCFLLRCQAVLLVLLGDE